MIAVIDYGAGNLTSVRKALAALGAEFRTPATPADVNGVRAIIVPGVGHFHATRAIDDEWREVIRSTVDRGAALFGICLGMQWLFEGSAEAPGLPGLGLLPGICGRLPDKTTQNTELDPTLLWKSTHSVPESHSAPSTPQSALKIPHVGWNSLDLPRPSALMAGIAPQAQVYFTHSYVAPVTSHAAATTTYGVTFASAVEHGRIAGVQFHPEKSGDVGLRILRNWLALTQSKG